MSVRPSDKIGCNFLSFLRLIRRDYHHVNSPFNITILIGRARRTAVFTHKILVEAIISWDCETITSPVPDHIKESHELNEFHPDNPTDFYQKFTHAYGIPILGSAEVSDDTLMRACYTVRFMLADREDLREEQYVNKGIRVKRAWTNIKN